MKFKGEQIAKINEVMAEALDWCKVLNPETTTDVEIRVKEINLNAGVDGQTEVTFVTDECTFIIRMDKDYNFTYANAY